MLIILSDRLFAVPDYSNYGQGFPAFTFGTAVACIATISVDGSGAMDGAADRGVAQLVLDGQPVGDPQPLGEFPYRQHADFAATFPGVAIPAGNHTMTIDIRGGRGQGDFATTFGDSIAYVLQS